MTAIDPTPDVLAALNEVRGRVREHLGELLDAIDNEGASYADRYAEHILLNRGMGALTAPPALRGPAAHIIRELVRDETTAVRLYGVKR